MTSRDGKPQWRVGDNGLTIVCAGRAAGKMQTPELAAQVVEAMNASGDLAELCRLWNAMQDTSLMKEADVLEDQINGIVERVTAQPAPTAAPAVPVEECGVPFLCGKMSSHGFRLPLCEDCQRRLALSPPTPTVPPCQSWCGTSDRDHSLCKGACYVVGKRHWCSSICADARHLNPTPPTGPREPEGGL